MLYDGLVDKKMQTGLNKVLVWDVLLLVPAGAFWVAAVLYVTLGNDYLFESVVAKIGVTTLGNALLIFLVVAAPGIVIATNGLHYVLSKKRIDKMVLIVAGILLVMGFFAVLKKG